jgi:predicted nucleic acid-binding protein
MAETERVAEAVCDAGPIIHLDELSALDLLEDFSAVVVPEAVWHEVEHHRSGALQRGRAILQRTVIDTEVDLVLAALAQKFSLGAGEQAAIQLARQRPNSILLTDDTAARLVAEGLSLVAHGTIGILMRAARHRQRTPQEVLTLLEHLPERSTLYLRSKFLTEIIQRFKVEHRL